MAYSLSELNFVTAGSGPPLVLIHGNPATHTLWRPITESLARIRTLYAVDLPGYGSSPLPATMEEMAREELAHIVLDWAAMQGLEQFDLVGHSFGGSVSATVADQQPERIRSLTLITPLGIQAPPAGIAAASVAARLAIRPLWKSAPGAVRRWFARRGARISYGAAYSNERAIEVGHEAGRAHMIDTMTEVMRRVDYPAYQQALHRLNDIYQMPLLLIGAGRDNIIPYAHFQQIRAILTRAQCHVFSEGGHVPMWQYPDEVGRLLVEFYGG
jgi:pimeloyl-ACP methyl ester carboxylesterase